MKKYLFILVSIIFHFSSFAAKTSEDLLYLEQPPRLTLLTFFSTNASNETRKRVDSGIVKALDAADIPYNIDTLDADMITNRIPSHWEKVLLKRMEDIKSGKYNVIIVVGDEAASVMKSHLSEVPQSTQVLFSCVTSFDVSLRAIHKNITAVIRESNPIPNINLGLSLLKNTKTIGVLTHPEFWSESLTKKCAQIVGDGIELKIIHVENESSKSRERIAAQLRELPPESFVISLNWDRFFINESSRKEMWNWIKKQYDGAVFVRRYLFVDYGVGGSISRLLIAGEMTGDIAVQIFNGRSLSAIEPAFVPEFFVFNYNELVKRNISLSALPPKSEILNMPPTWIERNFYLIAYAAIAAASFVIVLTGSFVYLFFSRRKMKINQSIYKALPVRVLVYDRDGNVLFFHRESGVESKIPEYNYKNISDIPWIRRTQLMDAIENVYDNGKPFVLDYDFYGEKRSATFARISDSVFGKTAVISVSTDSSALQEAQTEALNLAKRFSTTLQSIGDAVITTDKNELVTMINPVASKLTGYSPSQALGKPLSDIFNIVSYRDNSRVPSPLTEAIHSGEIVLLADHTDLILKDGSRRHISDSAAPIKDSKGDVVGAILVFRDVTDDYKKRDELSLTMTLLHQLSAQVEISYIKIDAQTQSVISLMGEKLKFCPYKDGQPVPLSEWIIPEDYNVVMRSFEDISSGKLKNFSAVIRAVYDGKMQYLHYYATGIEVKNDAFESKNQMIAIVRDITFDKERENKLNEFVSILGMVENNIPYPIFIKDIDDNFRYLRCNKTFAEHLNRNIEQVVGKTDYELMANPADADGLRSHDKEVANSGKTADYFEMYKKADGTPYKCHSIKQMIISAEGKRLLLGVSVDVTLEEEAKNAAIQKDSLLKSVFDNLPFGAYVKDVSNGSKFTLWNKALAEQTGLSPEIALGKTSAEINHHSFDSEIDIRAEENLLEGIECEGETRSFFHEKLGCDVVYNISRKLIEAGGSKYIFAFEADVSKYAELEAENESALYRLKSLSRSENLINECLTAINLESDFNKNVLKILNLFAVANKADRAYIYRIKDSTFLKDFEWSSSGVPSLDSYNFSELGSWLKNFKQNKCVVIESSVDISQEFVSCSEVLLAEGVKSLMVSPIYIDSNLFGFLGFDYTCAEFKFDEFNLKMLVDAVNVYKLLRERNERFARIIEAQNLQSTIFENIDIPMVIVDSSRTVKAINKKFFGVWKVDSEQIIGKKCYQDSVCGMRNTPYCSNDNCGIWKCLTEGKPVNKVREIDSRKLRMQATPVFDDAGSVIYAIETIVDITESERERSELINFIGQDKIIKQCMEIMIDDDDFSSAIKKMLKLLSDNYKSHSIVVFKYAGLKNPHLKAVEIAGANIGLGFDIGDSFPQDKFPLSIAYFKDGGAPLNVSVRDSKNFEDPIKSEISSYMKSIGVSDILLIPLFVKGLFWGTIAIRHDSSLEFFTPKDERIYQDAANFMGILLERELHKREIESEINMHSQIFDNVQLPMMMLDSQKRVVSVNKKCCEMFHFSKEELIGSSCKKTCLGVKDPKFCSPDGCAIWNTIVDGKNSTREYKKDSSFYRFETQPIFDEDGSVAYVIETIIDITQAHENQGCLESQSEELKAFNEQLQLYIEQDKTIASCVDIIAFQNNTTKAIEQLLLKLGPHLNSDNCVIYKYNEGEDPFFAQVALWTDSNAVHQLSSMDLIYEKDFPKTYKFLRSGAVVHSSIDDKNFDEEWKREVFQYLSFVKEAEIILAPLMLNGKFWGYCGVERKEGSKNFGSEGMRMFENIAHLAEVVIEREKHNEDMKSELAQKQVIFDLLPIAVVMLDVNLNVLNANPAAKKMWGLPLQKEITNTTCIGYCSRAKNNQPPKNCVVKTTILTGKSQVSQYDFSGKTYMVNTLPIFENGRVVKVLESLFDISEMEKTKELIFEAAINTKEFLQTKNNRSNLGENIVDALAKISKEFEKFSAEETRPDKKEAFEKLGASISNLLSMLEKSLQADSSSDRQGKKSDVNIVKMFGKLEKFFEGAAKEKNVKTDFIVSENCPTLLLEEEFLENVAASLVKNAIEHTTNGAVEINATYEEAILRNTAWLVVKIKDTGEGIADDLQASLFAYKAESRGGGGYAELSLAEVSELVEKMGGKIKVFSQLEKGSCFTIKIPVNTSQENGAKVAIKSIPNMPEGNGERVLVVDDVNMNVKVLSSMLKKMGYHVIGVGSAKEALEIIDSFKPQWILTDIWMPEINGVDFARSVLERNDADNMRIFAVTADAESRENFDTTCFEDVILKPVTVDKLKSIFLKNPKNP